MKNEKQIKEALTEYKEALEESQERGEETHDEYIFQGWVEALEFVLS